MCWLVNRSWSMGWIRLCVIGERCVRRDVELVENEAHCTQPFTQLCIEKLSLLLLQFGAAVRSLFLLTNSSRSSSLLNACTLLKRLSTSTRTSTNSNEHPLLLTHKKEHLYCSIFTVFVIYAKIKLSRFIFA